MSVWQAIVLGSVQGLTEFLPVSSSGHLLLFEKIFHIDDNLFLTLFLHLGTLFAVLVVYRKTLWQIIKRPFCDIAKKLYIASLITICLVCVFKSLIEGSFTGNFYILGFCISGFLLILTQILYSSRKQSSKCLTYKNACLMGFAQGLACVPGISRSGSTICAGLLSGCEKNSVADFSFLMSIPIIVASMMYEVIFNNVGAYSFDILALIVGFIVSFVFGLIAIKFMIKFIKKVSLTYFGIYLFMLSIILTVVSFL